MLGHLSFTDPRVDGLNSTQSQPMNPADPNSPRVPINWQDAVDGGPVDPAHDFDSITKQVFGAWARAARVAHCTHGATRTRARAPSCAPATHDATRTRALAAQASRRASTRRRR